MNRRFVLGLLVAVIAIGSGRPASGEDWPTYLKNNQRNAVTEEQLATPLSEAWTHRAAFPPQPAWPPPASQNYYGGVFGIEPWATHENALQVVVAGDSLYYGSPRGHYVCCVDIATGEPRWKFFTEGPVRYAPAVANARIYFGSDDGHIYCVDPQGKLAWKQRIGPSDRRLPGNGHMISMWPVRGGVVIEDGKGFACAGVFPEQGVYRRAFEPDTGKEIWKAAGGSFFDGYLVSYGGRLYVSGGRVGGQAFDMRDGKAAGGAGGRGTYIVAAGSNLVSQAGHRRSLSLAGIGIGADFAVCRDAVVYFHGRKDLTAMRVDNYAKWSKEKPTAEKALQAAQKTLVGADKEKDPAAWEKANSEVERLKRKLAEATQGMTDAVVWKRDFRLKEPVESYSLVMAGELLFSGRDGSVAAFSVKDGSDVWSGTVTGKVYGLAVAQGRLFASTDAGTIHCFAPGGAAKKDEVSLVWAPGAPEKSRVCKKAADVLAAAIERKGYCLVLGGAETELLTDLARATDLRIIAVESEESKISALRTALDEAGYSGRVSVHQGPFEKLPYPTYSATVVVLNGPATTAPAEVARVLQPSGGVAIRTDGSSLKEWMGGVLPSGAEYTSDTVLKRGPLPGAGEWTHEYANPANTATSLDPYARGRMTPLWFGDPGPRDMIDRHNRTMSSLFKGGRLIIPGNEKLIALNAYNGERLWDMDVPGSRRVGVLKDSGHVALSDTSVYIVVRNECWEIDQLTGKRGLTLSVPRDDSHTNQWWGYLAVVGDSVLGTAEKPGASFGEHKNMCPILEGDFRPVISSEGIFCLDRKTGAAKWERWNGALLNSAIAADDGSVYFLESRNPMATVSNKTGRMRIDHFLAGTNLLVALDVKSGARKWEQPVELPYAQIVYLFRAENLVIAVGTFNKNLEVSGKAENKVHYVAHAFDAASGKPAWESDVRTGLGPGGSHGEQWQHPVIMGGQMYCKFAAWDVATGKRLPDWRGGGPGKCGTWAASASAVFGRGGGLNLDTFQGIELTRINRQGCFVNIIPAGGILSVPETGAGCTCAYPVELSMAFLPVEAPTPIVYPLHRKFADKATVSFLSAFKDMPIRYTLDGSEPTESSTAYGSPFEIVTNTTVKARIWGPGAGTNSVSAPFVNVAPPAAARTGP